MEPVELEEVTAFLRVAETGSFTMAAQQLGLSKSAVSRRVTQLEAKLETRLLQRTTRKLHLTEVGVLFFERARSAMESLQEATRSVRALQGEVQGHMRLTAPADTGPMIARLIAAFYRRYPDVTLEFTFTQRAVDLVGEGYDAAFRAGALPDSSLVARKIGDGTGFVVTSPEYVRSHGAPQTVEELGGHPAILFRARAGKQRWSLVGPQGVETVTASGPMYADSFEFIRQAVLEGAGIALIPATVCKVDLERGRLSRLLPQHTSEGGAIYFVYPSAQFVSPKVVALRDFALEWFDQERACR
jgi:DNA-binding transcriptional LysR family regulator